MSEQKIRSVVLPPDDPQTLEEARFFDNGYKAGLAAYAGAMGHSTLRASNTILKKLMDVQTTKTLDNAERIVASNVVDASKGIALKCGCVMSIKFPTAAADLVVDLKAADAVILNWHWCDAHRAVNERTLTVKTEEPNTVFGPCYVEGMHTVHRRPDSESLYCTCGHFKKWPAENVEKINTER